MQESSIFLRETLPHAGPELLRLAQAAADSAGLLRSDFYTIRDWLEIAGCGADEDAIALLVLLMTALEEGSLCMEIDKGALERRLAELAAPAEAAEWARRIDQAIRTSRFAELIGTSVDDPRPAIVHERGGKCFVYFQRYLRADLDFQRNLQARLGTGEVSGAESRADIGIPWSGVGTLQRAPTSMPRADWPTLLDEVVSAQPFPLDPAQRLAILSALERDLVVISGGPGTGKTSMVRTLLLCLMRGGVLAEHIALAAPTGRAAQRLTDTLRSSLPVEMTAMTVHQLLGFSPSRNRFTRHYENPIQADVVIVDECSMVGLVLMSQLLQALAPSAKLILLGDKDQLPSVDAGAVFGQLVEQRAEPGPCVVLLETNHRSEERIRAAAQAINRQDAGIVDRLPAADLQALDEQAGCMLLEQAHGTAPELHRFLEAWAEHAYFHSRLEGKSMAELVDSLEIPDRLDESDVKKCSQLFRLLDRFRVLTLVRESAWGCEEINAFVRQRLGPRLDAQTSDGLFAGAPVLITRNDHARGLYNGDVGIALRSRRGLCVAFPQREGVAVHAAAALPPHELGFALTVHKSQGSEYDRVLLVLPPKGGRRLLTKELIYTAITRARSLALLCGTKEAFALAITRRITRESGLALD